MLAYGLMRTEHSPGYKSFPENVFKVFGEYVFLLAANVYFCQSKQTKHSILSCTTLPLVKRLTPIA